MLHISVVRDRYSVFRPVAILLALGAAVVESSAAPGVGHNTLFACGVKSAPANSLGTTPMLSSAICSNAGALQCPVRVKDSLLVRSALTLGVGHEVESAPLMRGAEKACWYDRPFRVVPEAVQVPEDFPERLPVVDAEQSGDVFHENVAGSKVRDEAGELGPEPSIITCALALSGDTGGLAWEPADEDIDSW